MDINSSKHYRYYQLYNQLCCAYSPITHTAQAKKNFITEQGETATVIFYEIAKFNPAAAGGGKGLTMGLMYTDSTSTLARLNGTILSGITDMQPSGETTVILWEWESGIGNNEDFAATAPTQEDSPMNTTTQQQR